MKNVIFALLFRNNNFRSLSLVTRLFLTIRLLTASFEEVMPHIPKNKKVLDVGCGHGLFAYLLENHQPNSQIIGIDPDGSKIEIAQRINQFNKKSIFEQSTLDNYRSDKKVDVIVLADVDYLLPMAEKKKLIILTKKFLSLSGIVFVKTTPKNKTLSFFLTYLQEVLSVRLLNFTLSQHSELYFLTKEEYMFLFNHCGYTVVCEQTLKSNLFHPHHLFILKKNKTNKP